MVCVSVDLFGWFECKALALLLDIAECANEEAHLMSLAQEGAGTAGLASKLDRVSSISRERERTTQRRGEIPCIC